MTPLERLKRNVAGEPAPHSVPLVCVSLTRPGMECWVTRDYGRDGKALHLSKAALGSFVYHLLRLGGDISGTHCLGTQYDRSYVQMAIQLPTGKRDELQVASGITLESPPRLAPMITRARKVTP